MATVGYTTTPSHVWVYTELNTQNQVGYAVTMPQAGTITSLSCYVSAQQGMGSTTAKLILWDHTGAILAESAAFTLQPGSDSLSGQAWQTQGISYVATSGQVLYIGWWRDANGTSLWGLDNGGSYAINTNTSGSPGTLSVGTTNSGTPGCYATYTPGTPPPTVTTGVKVWDGGAFQNRPVRVYLNGAWQRYAIKTWDGSTWQRRA